MVHHNPRADEPALDLVFAALADSTRRDVLLALGQGACSVSELAQAQQTGQVAPEQNLVPGEQRPVVRGYFR